MSLIYKERASNSPYVETVTQGLTVSDGSTIRPAECRWHLVFVRHRDAPGAQANSSARAFRFSTPPSKPATMTNLT